MKDEIVVAGYGGQGVVLAGSILAHAALAQGLYTTGMVSYGAEMRGGTANTTIIISDKKIGSPIAPNPNIALIMNQASLEKFEPLLKKNSLLIINKSECPIKPKRTDIKIIYVEATKMAQELGNKKVANFVMIGTFIKNHKTISLESVNKIIDKVLSKATKDIIKMNKEALLGVHEHVC